MLSVLPLDAAFSHQTAACLLDFPLPPRLSKCTDLHIITDTTTAQRRRAAWVGHRGLESRLVENLDGLPVVGAVDTWFDLAGYAVGRRRSITLADVVMIGDAVLSQLCDERGKATKEGGSCRAKLLEQLVHHIRTALSARRGPRGKSILVQALPLLRLGVRSPQESRARVLFVLAGLPEPEVNVPVYADDGLTWLAEGDLVWRRRQGRHVWKVVAEYQGEYHAERAQRSRDSQRSERLRDHGWTVHEVWAEDLNQPERRYRLIRRVARSLDVAPGAVAMVRWL